MGGPGAVEGTPPPPIPGLSQFPFWGRSYRFCWAVLLAPGPPPGLLSCDPSRYRDPQPTPQLTPGSRCSAPGPPTPTPSCSTTTGLLAPSPARIPFPSRGPGSCPVPVPTSPPFCPPARTLCGVHPGVLAHDPSPLLSQHPNLVSAPRISPSAGWGSHLGGNPAPAPTLPVWATHGCCALASAKRPSVGAAAGRWGPLITPAFQ